MLWLKLGWHYQAGNILAWLLAVFVTYFSNKFLVFSSKYHGLGQLLSELGSFLVVRLFALALDIVIIWLGIKVLHYNSFLVKLFDNTVVGILNYLVSKWYVFTDKNI
ncbi:GtrA family protein [Ligilactobacillus acidipiscis DSM 15836]|uniref:GtrA family protein n=2 Tax=Ligilactobacillus acidipiscis TaxID=89059 RepID=A0ABR5PHV3_9LACO|nr:GtrA family protein [Ligilactobacillus acidipiscis DSM 15836]